MNCGIAAVAASPSWLVCVCFYQGKKKDRGMCDVCSECNCSLSFFLVCDSPYPKVTKWPFLVKRCLGDSRSLGGAGVCPMAGESVTQPLVVALRITFGENVTYAV